MTTNFTRMVPAEIRHHAQQIEAFFANRGVLQWQVGGVRSLGVIRPSRPKAAPSRPFRARVLDVLDRAFMPKRPFTRVELDGSWCIVPPGDERDWIGEDDREDYTITTVYMTQRQFDALPEFEGF